MSTPPVWVTLTSMVQNQGILIRTLTSLMQQTHLPDRIFVYLSEEPYLLDEGFPGRSLSPELDTYLQQNPLVEVRWTANTGPYRKLAPLLKECIEKDWDAILITVDDDTVYHPRLLQWMLNDDQVQQGLACINYRGFRMDVSRGWTGVSYERRADPERISILNFATGKGGVLYHPHHFSPEVRRILFDSERWQTLCPTNDDIWWNFCRMASGTMMYLNNDLPYMKMDLSKPLNLFLHTNRETNTEWMGRAAQWFVDQFPTFAGLWPSVVRPLSTQFWCDRYARGESDSSANLYGDFLPQFLRSRKVTTVLDYGCGDGHQTRFFVGACPVYVGIDPSRDAIEQCRKRISARKGDSTFFLTVDEFRVHLKWDVTLSLNVLPFLDEDEVRSEYLQRLFEWSHLYVIIFYPVHHRRRPSVLQWIEQETASGWRLNHQTDGGFLVYKRVADELVLIRAVDESLVHIDCIQLVQYLRLLHLFHRRSSPHLPRLDVWTDDEAMASVIRVAYPNVCVDSPRQPDETVRVDVRISIVNDAVSLSIQMQPTPVYQLVYASGLKDKKQWSSKRTRGSVWVIPTRWASSTWFQKELRERRVRSNEELDWFVGKTTSWWTCL